MGCSREFTAGGVKMIRTSIFIYFISLSEVVFIIYVQDTHMFKYTYICLKYTYHLFYMVKIYTCLSITYR